MYIHLPNVPNTFCFNSDIVCWNTDIRYKKKEMQHREWRKCSICYIAPKVYTGVWIWSCSRPWSSTPQLDSTSTCVEGVLHLLQRSILRCGFGAALGHGVPHHNWIPLVRVWRECSICSKGLYSGVDLELC